MRKKRIKRLLAAGLVVAVLLGIFVMNTLATDATVTLDVSKKMFTFDDSVQYTGAGHNHKYVDLFGDEMKNLMPGDSVMKEISIAVNGLGRRQTANLYLQATVPGGDDYNDPAGTGTETVTNEMQKLLDAGCTLTVGVQNANGTKDITADLNKEITVGSGTQKATVNLGSMSNNGTLNLVVTFHVPLEAGNEIAGVVGEIGWIFLAELHTNSGGGGGGGGTNIPDPDTPTGGGGGGGGNPGINLDDPDVPLGPELDTSNHYAYVIGRDDGLVHPEANITRAEVATIFFRMLTNDSRNAYWSQENAYRDVSAGQWFNAAISTLSKAEVITGYPDGTFQPNGSITRAEFATMAVRFFELSYDGADLFSDIGNHWAKDFINKGASAGLISGYPDGTFRPQQDITRAEAVTLVNRTLARKPNADHLHQDMITWPDNADTGAWYYADMQEATNSHEYGYQTTEGSTEPDAFETWTNLQEVRNWSALEREWADNNASPSPGEVISSAV